MKYVPRYLPSDGYTADVEALLQELHRAEAVVHGLDHENFGAVDVDRIVDPATSTRAPTLTHRSGSILSMAQTAGHALSVPVDEQRWYGAEDGAGDLLSIELTLDVTTVVFMACSTSWSIPVPTVHACLDLRLLCNGTPGGAIGTDTTPIHAGAAKGHTSVLDYWTLPPGDYVFTAQYKERRTGTGVASPVCTVDELHGFLFGVAR